MNSFLSLVSLVEAVVLLFPIYFLLHMQISCVSMTSLIRRMWPLRVAGPLEDALKFPDLVDFEGQELNCF